MDVEVERVLLLCEALEEVLIIADRVDPILAQQVGTAFERADVLCERAMKRAKAMGRRKSEPHAVFDQSSRH